MDLLTPGEADATAGLARQAAIGHYRAMTTRFFSLAAVLALALGVLAPAAAQDASPGPAPPPAPPKLEHVAIETALGTIILALDATHAPVTTANFLRYADDKRFDGKVFYRVMRPEWGTQPSGLIQGGTSGDPKRNLPPIAHEPTSDTGILHLARSISMARFEPGSAAVDFSILLSPQPGLDARPDAQDPSSQAGFAAFGQVVAGMEVVRAIYDVPLSATKGKGFLKGQMIEKPVKIRKVRWSPAPLRLPEPATDSDGAVAP
jgi:peptidyl-prolyl cis-trans isomerase A (cyclophilin A)